MIDGVQNKINTQGRSPSLPSSVQRQWNNLSFDEKRERTLKNSFNFLITPLSFVSGISSAYSFIATHWLGGESNIVNKIAEISNRLSYFFNGAYGGSDNFLTKNFVGGTGYSLVSLASILGDSENVYFLKAPGSALDQLPSMNEELGYNKGVKEYFGLKDGEEKEFNEYKGIIDNVKKTAIGSWIVLKDIFKSISDNKSQGIAKAIWQTFACDERKAEKNLVVSSIGMLFSSFLGIFPKVNTAAKILRDIFGIHADLGLVLKGKSVNKAGDSVGSNSKYMACGISYIAGSVLDLIYRVTKIDKLNLLAVGLDNIGFWFMNRANATDNKLARDREAQDEAAAKSLVQTNSDTNLGSLPSGALAIEGI